MPISSGGQAPYAPPQSVIDLIQAFRNRPLQVPLTPEVLMRAGVKDSLVPRVAASLKLLDLVDNDFNPTAELEGLRRAAAGDYRARLESVIRAVYAEVFQYFDPATDGEDKARDIFRHYEPLGQLARIVRLFIGLCEEAGMIPEGRKKPSVATSTARPGMTRQRKLEPRRPPVVGRSRQPERQSIVQGLPSDPALRGLILALPSAEQGWTQQQRNKWVEAIGYVIDFAIPINGELPAVLTEDHEE